MDIHFFSEEIDFELKDQDRIIKWLHTISQHHNKQIGELNYIFCSDPYLLTINQTYLNHDYFTDIITFSHADGEELEGDIFISIDRIDDQSKEWSVSFEKELHRVMAHGLLHLIGFDDKNEEDQQVMTEKEDWSLSLLT